MPANTDRWTASTVTDQGPRRFMADAAHSARDRATGRRAWAVADGIGDEYEAGYAAELAARTAARAALRGGAAAGITAARAALQYEYDGAPRGQEGDCVIVTAVPMSARVGSGWDIAWVGDCRAYAVQGGILRQLTEDHTEGETMRRHPDPYWQDLASCFDHIVTRSVLRPAPIASVRITGTTERLLLCTDGMSKVLDAEAIAAHLTPDALPLRAARALVADTRARPRARDNIAATVIQPRTR